VSAGVEIRPYEESDLQAIVEFSLRAWRPVFESLRRVLGDPIFVRLNQPDWEAIQAEAVRSSCTGDELDAFVAVADGLPVGFAGVALNASTSEWVSLTSSPSILPTSGAESPGS
jgi:hypothetical protein